MTAPQLRVKDFAGTWVTKKLGAEAAWNSGGIPSKQKASFWVGDIPWISASTMRGIRYSDCVHAGFEARYNSTYVVKY